jgi:hypothetical protein
MKNKQKPTRPQLKVPGVKLSGAKISGVKRPGVKLPWMAPALALALLLNPFAYAAAQESSSTSRRANIPDQTAPEASPPAPSSTETPVPPLPDSPGSVQSAQLAPAPQPAQALPQSQPQSQPRPNEPLGTAAAETVPTMGVAASQPAGAALAPAKQRRVRTILIRVGAVLGVGAAVGVTMALSEGSPSKPPGAH